MIVSWGGTERCILTLPVDMPTDAFTDALQLHCQMVATDHASPEPATLTGKPNTRENPST